MLDLQVKFLLLLEDQVLDFLSLKAVPLIALVTVVVETLRPGKHLVNVLAALATVATSHWISARVFQDFYVVRLADQEEEALAS